MPVLDGNAVYQAMQADPQLRDIAVVITTSDPSIAPAGVSTMKKPVNLDVLIETVRKCCGDRGRDG
jgi:CheY-like chemotaxis protein